MSAENKLGSVPAGLEWIVKNKQQHKPTVTQEITINSSQEASIAQPAVPAMPTVESNTSYEQMLSKYEQHQVQAEKLYLELLQTKIKADKPGQVKKKKCQKSSHIGLQEGWTRATIIVKEDQLQKLRELSLSHDIPLKDVINIAFMKFLQEV